MRSELAIDKKKKKNSITTVGVDYAINSRHRKRGRARRATNHCATGTISILRHLLEVLLVVEHNHSHHLPLGHYYWTW